MAAQVPECICLDIWTKRRVLLSVVHVINVSPLLGSEGVRYLPSELLANLAEACALHVSGNGVSARNLQGEEATLLLIKSKSWKGGNGRGSLLIILETRLWVTLVIALSSPSALMLDLSHNK